VDGPATGDRLQRLDLKQRPRQLLMSAVREVAPSTLNDHGYTGFVSKPVIPSVLAHALSQALAPRAAGAWPAAAAQRGRAGPGPARPGPAAAGRGQRAEPGSGAGPAAPRRPERGPGRDGQEALELATGTAYDLILMDLQMP
jgi:DNA-binding NarL/FixJ family response regulator